MADDKLTFFEDETQEPQEAEAEQQEPEQEAKAPEPEQEPQQAEAEESTGEKEEASPPEATTDEQGRLIPVTALLDEREKRQKFEREAEELRRWKQEQERQRQPEKRPDFWESPEQAVQAYVTAEKLKQSKFLAEREFGADLVNEAYNYFEQNPQESHQLLNHPSPFHAAVEHYKRQKFLNEVQDPDAWREQERERLRQEILAEVQQSKQPRKAPPPSMAKATPAGRDAIAPGSGFDELFPET